MDIYLPIAGLAVNALLIVALGGLVGLLSGMFGVGGPTQRLNNTLDDSLYVIIIQKLVPAFN